MTTPHCHTPDHPHYDPTQLYHRVAGMTCTTCVNAVNYQAKAAITDWKKRYPQHDVAHQYVDLIGGFLAIEFKGTVPPKAQTALSSQLIEEIEFQTTRIAPPKLPPPPPALYHRRFFQRLLCGSIALAIGLPWLLTCLCRRLPSPLTPMGYGLRVGLFIIAVLFFVYMGLPMIKKAGKEIRHWQLGMQTLNCLSLSATLLYSGFIIFFPHTALQWGWGTHTLLGCFFVTLGALTIATLLKQILQNRILTARYHQAQRLLKERIILDPSQIVMKTYSDIKNHAPSTYQATTLAQVNRHTGFVVAPHARIPIASQLDHRCQQAQTICIDRYPETGYHDDYTLTQHQHHTHTFTPGCINKSDTSLYLLTREAGKKSQCQRRFTSWQICLQAALSHTDSAPLFPRLAHWLTVGIILSSLVTFLCWFCIAHVTLPTALCFGVSLLLNCPCAFFLSLSLPRYAAQLHFLQQNIIPQTRHTPTLKANNCLLVFDKAGTLDTLGSLQSDDNTRALIALLYPLEHAIGQRHTSGKINLYTQRICAWAKKHHIPNPNASTAPTVSDIQYLPGCGITGKVNGETVHVGNLNWIRQCVLPDSSVLSHRERDRIKGINAGAKAPDTTRLYVLKNQQYQGCLRFQTQLKPGTMQLFSHLKRAHIPFHILSGSSQASVEQIGKQLGIHTTQLAWEQTTTAKQKFIKNLKKTHPKRQCIMVGDGINDTLAMAASDVRIAVSPAHSPTPILGAHFLIPRPQALLTLLQAPTYARIKRACCLTVSALLFLFSFFSGSGLCSVCFQFTLPPAVLGLTMAGSTLLIYALVFIPVLIVKGKQRLQPPLPAITCPLSTRSRPHSSKYQPLPHQYNHVPPPFADTLLCSAPQTKNTGIHTNPV